MMAVPTFGEAWGYADVEQWIDSETSQPATLVGAAYEHADDLVTDRPGEEAWFDVYGRAELDQWIDDDGDRIRDEDEWREVDYIDFADAWVVMDGEVDHFSDSDFYWFDPIGPGVDTTPPAPTRIIGTLATL